MNSWDDYYHVRLRLVFCFALLLFSLFFQSWIAFSIALGIIVLFSADLWFWWLPGMSRREKFGIELGGAEQRKLRTETPGVWMAQSVRYFRDLGFFAADRDHSEEAIAERIAVGHLQERGVPFDTLDPRADLWLLKSDESRAWWRRDLEIYCEARVYARAIEEWGRISSCEFEPSEITEMWESDEGPILVEFTHGRERHMIETVETQFLDLGILAEINGLIDGRRFHALDAGDGAMLVVCVTPDERRRLAAERGWEF